MDIKVRGLCKSYGDLTVFDHGDFDFACGQTHILMGESGCGKTTLLRLLMGLEKPDGGTVEGVDPGSMAAVFQEDCLCLNLTPVTNVALVCTMQGSVGAGGGKTPPGMALPLPHRVRKRDMRRNIMDHLERVGLGEAAFRPTRELSGGMRRRVAIVRAMACGADTIFMDEPFKGLDEKNRDECIAYVRDLSAGKTLIVVTHSPEECELLGGQLHHMEASPHGQDDRKQVTQGARII
ncbi:MAG: ATP-binding cassette domain-containing protein [Lachnospiraceae bacterium]|jgi:NitT/TauT family transport system ATP-binding protein|nr:ATP-binding cassette domain-containing protein [Lachnospiraceae bacterium]